MSMDQRCLNEERLDIILQLADLERNMDKEVNKLRRKYSQTISRFNFNELEEIYILFRDIY